MKLFLAPALAAAVVAGGVWLAPAAASAQNYDRSWDQNQGQPYQQWQNTQRQNRNHGQNQNGATAWGDPWLNENDFDYNRRHWLPSNRGDNDRNQYSGENRYDNRYDDRYSNRYDGRGQYGRDQDDWNRQGNYDQRYRNNGQLGGYYDRGRNYNGYDDEDNE